MSKKQKAFLICKKRNIIIVKIVQVGILLIGLFIWELLSKLDIINTFIFSSPSLIVTTLINLMKKNLLKHILVTFLETITAFLITTFISIIIAIILYESNILFKILDPYLTMLNSLPKVALGPIIIIWFGANQKSIIVMAILISIVISIQNIFSSFKSTDENKVKLIKTFNGKKKDILFHVVLPSNFNAIISTLKINISMCLVGVVMGEFLTSKAGIGYLILYGSQVFNLNLVMSGIVVLILFSLILYNCVLFIEKRLNK